MPVATTPKRILIADPSEPLRTSIGHFLREKGFEVFEANDGSKALSETLLRKPDILLVDLAVAVLEAERLVQILRTNPNTKGIPIFFMSEREKSVSGFRQGIDEFLRKPFHEDEVLLRIQRALFHDAQAEVLAGDSEISGNLSQVYVPDLWQMLSMNQKSGIIQVEGERISGSLYIDNGEIVSAVTQNIIGEKALYRLVPLKEGKFRFIPGKVEIRRTIFSPTQHVILEGLRQYDELKKLESELPNPNDSVSVAKDTKGLGHAGGIVREVLLLAECCSKIGDIVNNCGSPDLLVYETILQLKRRDAIRIGVPEAKAARSEFLPPEDLARLRARIEERTGYGNQTSGRVVLFLPDPSLLESAVLALRKFSEFEVDNAFFSLRRKEGTPLGVFGKIRIGENASLLLYTFSYLRATSPLWYALVPRPVGILAFMKDEVSSSLEGLMAVSDYTRGTDTKVIIGVVGKTFTNFGLGENTIRLFQNRVEKLGCTLKIHEMNELSPEEIRAALGQVVRQYLELDIKPDRKPETK